jgi:hypothetical protein
MNSEVNTQILTIPSGRPNSAPITLDMATIYQAEKRLPEVKIANQGTALELEAFFNEAANLASKYLAWIEYEILHAEKQFDLDKATVLLEKAPEYFSQNKEKFKELGIKFNEDFRQALIARDEDCQRSLDTMNALQAAKTLIEAKISTFIRAHYTARSVAAQKMVAPSPAHNGFEGQTYLVDQQNFMGKTNGR